MDQGRQSKPDILLIIIDQLRLDYLPFLEKTGRLLPYHAICSTGSIPSSTEAMHTNISTGLWPKNHGFISKNPKGRENKGQGLDQLIEKFKQGAITPIGHIASANGYQVINLGAKEETVLTMSLQKHADLQVASQSGKLLVRGKQDLLVDAISAKLKDKKYDIYPIFDLGMPIIDLASAALRMRDAHFPLFLSLALPDIDYYGHKFGPHSPNVIGRLKTLDEHIANMLEEHHSFMCYLVGDHGCRRTVKYVMETEHPHLAHIYHEENDELSYEGKILFDNSVEQIEYDGGILRLWFSQRGATLDEETIKLISTYGKPIDARLPSESDERVSRSIHENLGELVVIANNDATFCKRSWIDKEYHPLIEAAQPLPKGSYPLGEHGTYHCEDTAIPLLSNQKLEKDAYLNIELNELVKNDLYT
jgi:hypothetical protein